MAPRKPATPPATQHDGGAHTTLSATDARQGEIIPRTPLRRAIFVAGLAVVVVALILARLA